MTFGEYIKDRRISLKQTLRHFCENNGYDPGNQSKLERSILPAPKDDEKLVDLASALCIKQTSKEWTEFADLAAASQGIIPKDILSDQEVVAHLPLVFRTLRGERPTQETLNALVDHIRRNP